MTAPAVSPLTMSRLGFIRMLYQQGIDQAARPEPLNATSVLTLHDATELLLALSAEHLGANQPREFMKYWTELDPANLPGGVKLTGRQGMNRLNSIRVALKHHGTIPGSAAVELACNDVRVFFEQTVLSVFGISFADIDMAEVIPQASVRDTVKAATAAAAAGDLTEAMGLLAEAHDDLFDVTRPQPPGGAPGRFGKAIQRGLRDSDIVAVLHQENRRARLRAGAERQLASQIDDVTNATRLMQRALRVMALGIDYWDFERFQQLTPSIAYMLTGTSQRRVPDGYAPTAEEFDFCRQFIVTLALRIADRRR